MKGYGSLGPGMLRERGCSPPSDVGGRMIRPGQTLSDPV